VTGRVRAPAVLCVLLLLAASACTGGGGAGKQTPGLPTATPGARIVQELRLGSAGFGLPNPVQREVAVADGSTLFLAGGLNAADQSVSGVFSLDPSSGRVTGLGSVPRAFHDAAGAVIGHRLFVFGGGTGQGSDVVQWFDPGSRSSGIASHLPQPLSDLAATAVGGRLYLVGGWNGTTFSRTIYSTTDGRRFAVVGQLPLGLRYPGVATVGGSIVVVGGMTSGGPSDAVSVFDTASGRTSSLGRLPAPVGHAAAFALGGIVYVVGGLNAAGHATRGVASIDPGTKRIASLPSLIAPLSDAGVATVGGSVYLIGGWRQTAVNQVLQASVVGVTVPPPPALTPSAAGPSAASVRPFAGLLLIADRGNNRLLVMDADKRIVWRYPAPNLPPPPFRFYFPDDAFWVHGGHAIMVSEEENSLIEEIAYPSGRWSGLTATRMRPARRAGTSTSRTTPTPTRVGAPRWPTPRTAGSSSSTQAGKPPGRSA
jgi:hypothetical protein